MSSDSEFTDRPEARSSGVARELQDQPHILLRLAENSLTVADSLRDNYLRNTATFVSDLRKTIRLAEAGRRSSAPLEVFPANQLSWKDVQDEVVTFIDGGIGEVRLAGQVPILLRVGSYAVRTGEHDLTNREQFGYYPIILGDLEGGSKERGDFVEIVRITAELLAALAALERTPSLRVLLLHGPLVYQIGFYGGHAPFTEQDIDLFLHHYAHQPEFGRRLKEDFYRAATVDYYPTLLEYPTAWSERRLVEPLTWIMFLYRKLIELALERDPVPIIAGVVERGRLREFAETVVLERVFRGLRDNGRIGYFNEMFGRDDLTSPKALLDRLGYSDELLLGMVMRESTYTESWSIRKYDGLQVVNVPTPGEPRSDVADFRTLVPTAKHGFPDVEAAYVHTSRMTDPIRVEVFPELGQNQIHDATQRVHLYARLLPGYGFPIGLDIADRYAHVPQWLSDAYGKLIRQHLSAGLMSGQISDAQLRQVLVNAIYMTHRDWLFRPDV